MCKQLFDACASSGTECNSEREQGCREQLADFSKLTNHNWETCDPPPAMTSLCRRFLHPLYMWECFPHSKNIKIRSSANLWQARTRKGWFFSKEVVRLRLLLRPVHVWVAPNRKTTYVFLKKTDSSILIWIFNRKLELITAHKGKMAQL